MNGGNIVLKRLGIYFKEMYPLVTRFALGVILFLEIYFMIYLNMAEADKSFPKFQLSNIGIQEVVGGFTIFCFLMFLRIADDFKDYELDCRLFAHRPLPSGRVTKKDLKICLAFFTTVTVVLNIVFIAPIFGSKNQDQTIAITTAGVMNGIK